MVSRRRAAPSSRRCTAIRVPASRFARTSADFGPAQELGEAVAVLGEDRDADARLDVELESRRDERGLERSDDLEGHALGGRGRIGA